MPVKKVWTFKELIISNNANINVRQEQHLSLLHSDILKLKEVVRRKKTQLVLYIKTIINRYNYWKYLSAINSNVSRKKGNILIIKAFDHSKQFIKDANKEGYSLQFFENDSISTSSLFSKKRKIPFKQKILKIILHLNI